MSHREGSRNDDRDELECYNIMENIVDTVEVFHSGRNAFSCNARVISSLDHMTVLCTLFSKLLVHSAKHACGAAAVHSSGRRSLHGRGSRDVDVGRSADMNQTAGVIVK